LSSNLIFWGLQKGVHVLGEAFSLRDYRALTIVKSRLLFLTLTLLDLDPDSPALINADPDPQHNKANPELECITAISKEC
jgi:hypothetical protein